MLFERICRTRGIQQRLTKIRAPTTTGKIERFHQSLQVEFLDDCGVFADLAAAQAALEGWVEAYNDQRPHQSLNMATPASRFHATGPAEEARGRQPRLRDQAAVPPRPRQMCEPDLPPTEAAGDLLQAVEVDLPVPASGTLSLAGRQQVWVGRAFTGRTVAIWADRRSIHLSFAGDHFKTVPSRLGADDLLALTARDGRPAEPQPAAPALRLAQPVGSAAIEVERTTNRDGVVNIGGQKVTLGASLAGQRVVLRLDGHLMHVIAAGHLVKTLPAAVPADERGSLLGAQLADGPLPPPVGGPALVRRRVPADGVVMVSRQRLRIGRVHAGKTVTVAVEDTHYRVLHNSEELSTHPRNGHNPVRTTKPYAPRRGPKTEASRQS